MVGGLAVKYLSGSDLPKGSSLPHEPTTWLPSTFPMFQRPKPPFISKAVQNSSRLTFAWLLLGQRPTGLSPGSLQA